MSGRTRTTRRVALTALVAALLLSLQGCVFFIPNSIRAFNELRKIQDQALPGVPAGPEIDIVLAASGGDAIDVFFPRAGRQERFLIAVAAAEWLRVGDALPVQNEFDPDVVTVQLDRRLPSRVGAHLVLTLETGTLQRMMRRQGYTGFHLFVCHPAVETRYRASRAHDYPEGAGYCFHGGGWRVSDDGLQVSVTMLPDTVDYLRFLAGVVLGIVLFGSLAWFVGDKLRRGPFRHRGPGAVALGLIAGAGASVAGLGATVGVAAAAGPADNLALAKDLGVGMYALSVALPGLAAMIPGVVFATLLMRKRPWPAEEPPEIYRSWPAPPPPGGSEGRPPPPIPYGVR